MEIIKISHLDEEIVYDVCDNGLHIYLWKNARLKNYYATLNVKYGSIHTEFKIDKNTYKVPNGIAHFLEHLNFNKPDKTSSHDFFSKTGADCNAYTSFDHTSYLVTSTDHFEENINELLNYVMTPYFTKDMVKQEMGIITEEIMMYEDAVFRKIYFELQKSLLKNDKKRIDIGGTVEDIKKTTVEDLMLIHKNFYHPKNMFLVITGNIDIDSTLLLIKENQSNKQLEEYKNPKVILPKEPKNVVEKYKELYLNVEIPKLNIAFKYPRKLFDNLSDTLIRIYLNSILNLNFGGTSDFNENLLKENLITGLSYGVTVEKDYILVDIDAESDKPKEVIEKIKEQYFNINIDKKSLNRMRKINIASSISLYDNSEAINSKIVNNLINYGEVISNGYELNSQINIDVALEIVDKLVTDNYAIIITYPKEKNRF